MLQNWSRFLIRLRQRDRALDAEHHTTSSADFLSRALRVPALLEAGQIYVNEYQTGAMIETPFGGYKMSGYGREKGVEALHCYTQVKCVTVKL